MLLAPDVTLTVTERGMVLLDERSGRYWTLNATGATVVRMLLDGETVDDALAALRDRHPSAADRIAADVERFLASLRDAKVVRS
ncbi:lasso peptide biosynthesis PqqD family chaperone [Allonocardiopsis opalescens]|uniref:Coenzyme PQQ synthesis protein D (PqqD) n=1 Tax=Allonocardiopsis opalescens TaxID=1144618 RepID=A0A2T0Q2M2_9ACTN|nr:lasso peptide biosynthesis PqqD family chaperone [Allonocardiopsis opalescens]PRX98043.1 coenzyme PQQ synthesis protein D (PqqD) [Allonocardiopsis opalescens]